MSNSKLAALKALYSSEGSKNEGPRENFSQNNYYPFWNMKPGQRAIIRFLPDVDASNPRGFMVEKVFHTLTINGQKRSVPSLSMYGEDCPISKVSQDFYKAGDTVNGKKYWRKKQYLAQAIIVEDPLPADATTGETHQGKVRIITLGYQIYNIIKEAFASQDDPLEADPSDFKDGYDFIIKKTEQGEYSTYTMGTKFMSKQRSLTEEELMAAQADMVELKTLLPKNPGREKIQALLNADLNGEDYQEGNASAPRATPTPTRKVAVLEEDDVPFDGGSKVAAPAPKPVVSSDAEEAVDDMLAAIRARRKATPVA